MNKHLLISVFQSGLIWITTNALGAAFVYLINSRGFHYVEILLASLLFSSPVKLLLIPLLSIIPKVQVPARRIALAMLAVLTASIGIVILFFGILRLSSEDVTEFLPSFLPFILSAQASFLLLASKQVFGGEKISTLSDILNFTNH